MKYETIEMYLRRLILQLQIFCLNYKVNNEEFICVLS
jgi:hypothetical protein